MRFPLGVLFSVPMVAFARRLAMVPGAGAQDGARAPLQRFAEAFARRVGMLQEAVAQEDPTVKFQRIAESLPAANRSFRPKDFCAGFAGDDEDGVLVYVQRSPRAQLFVHPGNRQQPLKAPCLELTLFNPIPETTPSRYAGYINSVQSDPDCRVDHGVTGDRGIGHALVRLAEGLFQCFGHARARLQDMSKLECPGDKRVALSLPFFRFLTSTGPVSFYEDHGYVSIKDRFQESLPFRGPLLSLTFQNLLALRTHPECFPGDPKEHVERILKEYTAIDFEQQASAAQFVHWLWNNHCGRFWEVMENTLVFPCQFYPAGSLLNMPNLPANFLELLANTLYSTREKAFM